MRRNHASSKQSAENDASAEPTNDANGIDGSEGNALGDAASSQASVQRRPWEYVDELMSLLKTAFPLLALSMETMVDQILQRLKPTADEDIYRLVVALLSDAIQVPAI